ncbi:hypothetical protein [Chryseobacterium sp. FH1]|uniref:hypothetical protein n=1 Tax=Chryseobacterium sp. FH1 TaxID=1233951 RepID=UPI0004E41811|nr:hypothetical protein [Chryseobacterium sp. FH1]KFC23018.1 hypothetical protein IO90_05540 [Chryseobacterium sp. FH1]
MKKQIGFILLFVSIFNFAQENNSKVNVSFFDGIAVAGYVDDGGFFNFTGPNVNLVHRNTKIMLGMLPSIRIKEDRSETTKNSILTPTLGMGITVAYRKLALQIPFYYNAKTATENGKWKMGIGLGYRFK